MAFSRSGALHIKTVSSPTTASNRPANLGASLVARSQTESLPSVAESTRLMADLAPGSLLGPYRIVAKLGEGGMGAVYRAHDARLERDVALKVLHPDLSDDPVRLERFTREARAVAALSHPHIVTIYSTEESGAVRFLTMEIVDGTTLDALIVGEGLGIDRFFELALPLTDALAAAHQRQIVHRDLKPGQRDGDD